ncbi:MAG: proliferating cell nuclear antigen (pcna) [Nanoarchaeota archaeon]|jgi:proliferating cell nuclear antigen|nr:proliferating cell nuclear antigen (pcna) [Nanoarchaeota archaeon]
MKLKLNDATLFAKSIDLISELVMEVKIKVNEFGLSIVAIDPANVSMVSLKVPKSSFQEFEVEDENLGISLESLKKVLRRCGKSSALTLERNENMLEIKIEDKIKRSFSLSLIEIDAEDKEFPAHLEFSSKIDIDSQELTDAIDDCAVVSDACSFVVENGKFVVETKNINKARTEFSSEDVKVNAEDCRSRYSIDYLQKFMKAGKAFDRTHLNFANDHPIRVDFKSEVVSLSFLLAPRIETDD